MFFNDERMGLSGMRYCINSASLKFITYEELAKKGYEEFIAI
ncbi:hypothetical protein [Mycoplasma sp. E35C]|nr:hypothetical protein [Mycoplasma sp. E35C]